MLGRAVFTGKLALSGEALHPDRPDHSVANADFVLAAGTARDSGGPARLAAHQATHIRSYPVLRARDVGVAASNYFYYVAIQKTSVAIAIIVQYTAPVWVLLYVVARRQQKLSLQKIAAVAVASLASR